MSLPGGRGDAPPATRGSSPGQLDGVRIQRRHDLGDARSSPGVGDHDDDRGPGRRSRGARATRRSSTASLQGQPRGVPGREVEPDGVGPGPDAASTPSASVTPQIFTNGRPATFAGSSGSRPAATNERDGRGGIRRIASRASPTSAASNPSGAPAGDRRRVADAGLGDDQPVVRDERPKPDRPLGVDLERPQVAVVQADQPGVRRERPLAAPARRAPRRAARARSPAPGRRATRAASAGGGRRAAGRGRRRRPGGSAAGSASTTNSLARTGIDTAARTARRSSTDPPNQWGSHRTEIAAAPPASYARARATMSSSCCAISPADGERRLISAMRWSPGGQAFDDRARCGRRERRSRGGHRG